MKNFSKPCYDFSVILYDFFITAHFLGTQGPCDIPVVAIDLSLNFPKIPEFYLKFRNLFKKIEKNRSNVTYVKSRKFKFLNTFSFFSKKNCFLNGL